MSQQLISKMGKQSILQRQAAAAALKVQKGVRQRPLSCLTMCSDRQNAPTTSSISSFGPQSLRRDVGQRPSCLASTTATTALLDQRVRWFSEGGGDDKKSQKEKKKEMKQKAKEAAAAKAAETEAKEEAPASKEEAPPADKKDEPTEAKEAPPKAKEEEEKPKEEEKKEEDDVPEWQNPLHHNNPEMKKMFPEDFGPGEEMPIAEAPPLADPDNPEKILASQELYDLADEIVSLSMLEMKELVNKIGDHFGFEKPPFVGSDGSGGGGDDADEEGGEGEVAEAAAAKTAFDIKLVSFDDKAKIKVIKEVRALAGLGLKEAKEMVEGAPGIVMKDIGKEQAEELKEKLEAAGATVEIV